MRLFFLCTLVIAASAAWLRAQETVSVRAADGFQYPVGLNGSGEGYYIARGYRPNGHLGEDWNGVRGGDTDLGDPVYAIANGLVVFAKNYHVGWGNVVIIRHAYYEGFALKFVDSLYGHLLEFKVTEGQQIRRGQLIGQIGSNNGMYDAHLHFEMRKNLSIGMYRSSFARDFSNYWSPKDFITAHQTLSRGNKVVSAPINTFPSNAPPSYAAGSKVHTPVYTPASAPASHRPIAGAAESSQRTSASEPELPARSVTSARVAAVSEIDAASRSTTPSKSITASRSTAASTTHQPVVTSRSPGATPAPEPTVVTTDPLQSMLPSGSPIRRSSPSFRVDRFEDLRNLGY